jgi:hypothetical protein
MYYWPIEYLMFIKNPNIIIFKNMSVDSEYLISDNRIKNEEDIK